MASMSSQREVGLPDGVNDFLPLVPWYRSRRYLLAFILFIGFSLQNTLRSNLSIALVCMVRHDVTNTSLDNVTPANNTYGGSSAASEPCRSWEQRIGNDTDVIQEGEFTWSKEMQGILLGGVFWGYMGMLISGGWLADRFGATKVIALGMFPTATATLLSPIAARISPYFLLALRIFIGFSSSVMFPSIPVFWSRWAPPGEWMKLLGFSLSGNDVDDLAESGRLFHNTGPALLKRLSPYVLLLTDGVHRRDLSDDLKKRLGGETGNAYGYLLNGFLCRYGFAGGWPSIFYVTGGACLLWCILWSVIVRDSPAQSSWMSVTEQKYIEWKVKDRLKSVRKQTTPWLSLVTSGPVWALVLTHTMANFFLYLLFTQMPSYLNEVTGVDFTSNGIYSMLPYVCMIIVINVVSHVSDVLIHRVKLTVRLTRRIMNSVGMFGSGTMLIVLAQAECGWKVMSVTSLCLTMAAFGCCFCGHIANFADITEAHSGTLAGVSDTANRFWDCCPGAKDEWQRAFYIASGVSFLGGLIFAVFSDGKPQPWDTHFGERRQDAADDAVSDGSREEIGDIETSNTCLKQLRKDRDITDEKAMSIQNELPHTICNDNETEKTTPLLQEMDSLLSDRLKVLHDELGIDGDQVKSGGGK